jgi:hypothetical protein
MTRASLGRIPDNTGLPAGPAAEVAAGRCHPRTCEPKVRSIYCRLRWSYPRVRFHNPRS